MRISNGKARQAEAWLLDTPELNKAPYKGRGQQEENHFCATAPKGGQGAYRRGENNAATITTDYKVSKPGLRGKKP